jgi:ribose 5-phosphate isomerase A
MPVGIGLSLSFVNTLPEIEQEKRLAAERAAELVADGMAVGLGTGTTVAHLLPVLAALSLRIRCVATSPETETSARELGLDVEPFDRLDGLDIAIDGADQVAPDGWLVKGGGGAHTREKIVAAAADRFVVIADSTKAVERIRPPIPLELSPFGAASTLRALGTATLRDAARSPDGGLLADYRGEVRAPEALAGWLSGLPGVIEHGLFGPPLVDRVLVARGDAVETLFAADD